MTIDSAPDPADRLSYAEAGAALGLHPETVRNWSIKGIGGRKMKRFHFGRKWYVRRADLDQFIAQNNQINNAG